MLVALVLYGSRARGDHRQKSDVDLLGVVEEGLIRKELTAGGTSLYQYPYKLLLQNSIDGDLFALHLVKEGIVLHDSFGAFQKVKESFAFKADYSNEITAGYFVIRFFQDRPHLLRNKRARKRLVWAIRTILIAISAERQEACFSSDSLAQVSRIGALKRVIDNRNLPEFEELLAVAIKVGEKYGKERFTDGWPQDKTSQRDLMKEKGGLVADTLKFVQPIRTIRFRNIPKPELVERDSDYS